MKYYTFKRESDNFDDILKDSTIKFSIKTKLRWKYYLMIGLDENNENENIFGYLILKYGEDIVNPIEKDYTPIPRVDYMPKR